MSNTITFITSCILLEDQRRYIRLELRINEESIELLEMKYFNIELF
jgi:hypothetical protein